MLELLTEDLIALREVPKMMPEVNTRCATRPSIQTLIRWCNVGVGGVRLESTKVGFSRITSRQAVKRFISKTGRERPQMEPCHETK